MAGKKQLRFASDLVPLVLSGQKTSTWRLWDDKDLQEGDVITLIRRPELTPFAVVKITSCIEKLMGELTEADKKGHEPFRTDEEMLKVYSEYYKKPVGSETPVKILRFKLLQKV